MTTLTVVLPILQGLLASGHYTSRDENGIPFTIFLDHSDAYAKKSFRRRFETRAIADAIELAQELQDTLLEAEQDAKEP